MSVVQQQLALQAAHAGQVSINSRQNTQTMPVSRCSIRDSPQAVHATLMLSHSSQLSKVCMQAFAYPYSRQPKKLCAQYRCYFYVYSQNIVEKLADAAPEHTAKQAEAATISPASAGNSSQSAVNDVHCEASPALLQVYMACQAQFPIDQLFFRSLK